MSYSVGRGTAVVALLACSTLLTGCISRTIVYSDEQPEQPVVVQQRKFYYYPSSQAYRDCETNRWHWVEGGVWKASTTPPRTVVVVKEAPRLVVIDTDEPKYRHATIMKQYPVQAADNCEPSAEHVKPPKSDKSWDHDRGNRNHDDDRGNRNHDDDRGHGYDKNKNEDKGKSDKKDEKSDKDKSKDKDKDKSKGKSKKKD